MIRILALGVSFLLLSCQFLDTTKMKCQGKMELWTLANEIYYLDFIGKQDTAVELFKKYHDCIKNELPVRYFNLGLKLLDKVGDKQEVLDILQSYSEIDWDEICQEQWFSNDYYSNIYIHCNQVEKTSPTNLKLMRRILIMGINDQYARESIDKETIDKYDFNIEDVFYSRSDMGFVDSVNLNLLKEIVRSGYPSKEEVGVDAMNYLWLLVQHSSGDKEFRKNQLPSILALVNSGDLSKQKYAYLYDRVAMQEGRKQLYGTQVDEFTENDLTFYPIKDSTNVDSRRMEMDMMPIETYKRLFLHLERNSEDIQR